MRQMPTNRISTVKNTPRKLPPLTKPAVRPIKTPPIKIIPVGKDPNAKPVLPNRERDPFIY